MPAGPNKNNSFLQSEYQLAKWAKLFLKTKSKIFLYPIVDLTNCETK